MRKLLFLLVLSLVLSSFAFGQDTYALQPTNEKANAQYKLVSLANTDASTLGRELDANIFYRVTIESVVFPQNIGRGIKSGLSEIFTGRRKLIVVSESEGEIPTVVKSNEQRPRTPTSTIIPGPFVVYGPRYFDGEQRTLNFRIAFARNNVPNDCSNPYEKVVSGLIGLNQTASLIGKAAEKIIPDFNRNIASAVQRFLEGNNTVGTVASIFGGESPSKLPFRSGVYYIRPMIVSGNIPQPLVSGDYVDSTSWKVIGNNNLQKANVAFIVFSVEPMSFKEGLKRISGDRDKNYTTLKETIAKANLGCASANVADVSEASYKKLVSEVMYLALYNKFQQKLKASTDATTAKNVFNEFMSDLIDIPLDPNLRDFNFDAEIISNVFKNLENLTGLVSDSSNKTDFQQLQNFIKSLKERANYTNYDTATKKFPVDYVSKALIK